jgi:outer membrane biogenesis lipoprotein LolB
MILFLLVGCTTAPVKPSIMKFAPLKSPQKPLFPNGKYRHHVDLHIYHAEKDHFSFDGLAETTDDTIRIVVLSPFNTTLAKISEDRKTGEAQMVAYDARVRRYQDKFSEYYADLRQLFAMPFDEKNPEQAHHLEIKRPQYELQIEVERLE